MIEDLYAKYCSCGYRVTTDSRAVQKGEMFFALRGENFDGNAYALQALQKGAAWAVVNSDAEISVPEDLEERIIRVGSPFETLKTLAIHHRNSVRPLNPITAAPDHLPVIGLTGTNGKTTTKELITAALGAAYKVTATAGNFNNDIGVPLSLLRITPDTQIAVIEMGANHPDDIAKLVQVSQPDYGLITNVGRAHLLGFGSFEGVKAAKGELYKYLSGREGSVVFLNNDDESLRSMASQWVKSHVWCYGLKYQGAELLPVTAECPFLGIRLSNGKTVRTSLVGSYNAANVLAALAVAQYFGVDEDAAIAAIESYIPGNARSQMQRTERNTVVVDAYNANPSSVAAALENFAAMDAPGKVALLGEMRELGAESVEEHRKVLSLLRAYSLAALFVGDEFLKAGADPTLCFATSNDLAAHLRSNPITSATVLVKGSRGTRMENVLPEL